MLLNSWREPVPAMGNIAMHGQINSEKCWSRMSRLRRTEVGMSRRRSYSRGATEGRRVQTLELLVDQARVCAEPQATLVIFLPWKNKKKLFLFESFAI